MVKISNSYVTTLQQQFQKIQFEMRHPVAISDKNFDIRWNICHIMIKFLHQTISPYLFGVSDSKGLMLSVSLMGSCVAIPSSIGSISSMVSTTEMSIGFLAWFGLVPLTNLSWIISSISFVFSSASLAFSSSALYLAIKQVMKFKIANSHNAAKTEPRDVHFAATYDA